MSNCERFWAGIWTIPDTLPRCHLPSWQARLQLTGRIAGLGGGDRD